MTEVEWKTELQGAEKLFALSSLANDSSAYNLLCIVKLQAKVPKEQLPTATLIENITKAVNKVHVRHPLLQAVIPKQEEVDAPLFFTKFKLPRPVDIVVTEKTWQDAQESELNTPFAWNKLLYRVKFAVDASYVMITMHHCLADAGALLSYVSDLLTVLDSYNMLAMPDCDQATILKELANVAPLDIPEQPYAFVTARQHLISLNTLEGTIHAGWTMVQPHKKHPDVMFPMVQPEPKDANKTRILSFALPKESTKKMIETCKNFKVSVPSYICAIAAKSIADTAAHTAKLQNYETHVPFNMTRDLRKNPTIAYPAQNVRSCSGGFGQMLLVKNNSDLYELASQIKKSMVTSLAMHEDVAAFLLQTPSNYTFIHKLFPSGPPFPIMIGSLGIVESQYKTIDVELLNTGLAIHDVMDCCSLAFFTSANSLHVCLTYSTKQEEKPVLAWWHEFVKQVSMV